MDGPQRPTQVGYEETGEEDNGECWRLNSLSHPKTPHFCRSCMLGFRDRILLNNHLKEHYLENKATENQEQVADVIIKDNSEQEQVLRCLNCKESFASRSQLKLHSETCLPESHLPESIEWQCDVCDDLFPDKIQLHAHFLAAHSAPSETTQCPHCRLHFETKHDLKVHIEIEHEMDGAKYKQRDEAIVSVACECGKVFVNELNYQEHILEEHPGSEPIKWPRDVTSLKKRRRLESGGRHRMSGQPAKRGKSWKNGGYPPTPRINQELRFYDGDGDGTGVCVECGETFAAPADLRRHMQNDHIHLKPYACSICGRRFTRKSDVKRHIETIHGQAVSKEDMDRIQAVRPFRCAKCGNPFGRYSDIRKHIEVHHGLVFSPDTYVYQLEHLDEAGLSIGSSGEVVNVRTFECGLCKRKYRNKTTVRHHIRKDHNQEDPDAFITRSAYNHSDLECQYCGTTFGCREDKLEHIQQIHQTVLIEEDNMVDTPLSGVLQQGMMHREDECENFMPVKDVNTPEKVQRYTKNQIVILQQEVINAAPLDHRSAPLDHRSAPLEHRAPKKDEDPWSNTLINDLVTEQAKAAQTHTQTQTATFDCAECSRSFTRSKALSKHMLRMHGGKGDEFECDMCGKSYKEQAQFVKHLQVAHPEVGPKPTKHLKKQQQQPKTNNTLDHLFYNCDPCQKTFPSEAELVEHLDTTHSMPERVKPKEGVSHVVSTQSIAIDDMPLMEYYTCNVCRAMFSSTESLTRHMNLKHKDISVVTSKTSLSAISDKIVDKAEDSLQNISVEYT